MSPADRALFTAVAADDELAARAALAAGADPNVVAGSYPGVSGNDVPALVAAAFEGARSCVELLIAHGAHVGASATRWLTYPFSDDDVEFPQEDALQCAAAAGRLDMVELLLSKGARRLHLALIAAAEAGHLEVVRRLLDAGVHPLATDGDLHTAAAHALGGGHVEVLDLLLARGGGFSRAIDLRDGLRWARRGGHVALAKRIAARRPRDLIPRHRTRWALTSDEAPAAVLIQVSGALFDDVSALGPATSSEQSESGGQVIDRTHHALGARACERIERRLYDPPTGRAADLTSRSLRFRVGALTVSSDDLDAEPRRWAIEVTGHAAALDEADAALATLAGARWLGAEAALG